ncbi:hypothetical protein FZEAL_4215 [Fusarium zealandicum]|uniref:Alpha-1,3-mannosyltransferase n=1 Tax=Fusarium zealandicum TaxID=1053134 RepID=A0A8H4XLS5_9HYPO|nr:hypothetical protein FZEAL_4215 [Fusarium zealandicum]
MHRRIFVLFVPAFCFMLIVTGLYLGRDHITRLSHIYLPLKQAQEPQSSPVSSGLSSIIPTSSSISASSLSLSSSSIPTSISFATSTPIPNPSKTINNSQQTSASSTTPSASYASAGPSKIPIADGKILSAKRISPYITAILDPNSKLLPRLECPPLKTKRYEVLRKKQYTRDEMAKGQDIDFFFALNLRDCVDLLPRLMGSIVEAVRFLGPHRCALSIVEGNSPDGTSDVLIALRPYLEEIGLAYIYSNSAINPSKGARIRKLAELRNLALKPLYKKTVKVTEETTVLFINDVAACTEDLLELAYQRKTLNADMTCAMDWVYLSDNPTFYDVWVARGISGDTFFPLPGGSWDEAWNLLSSPPETKARFDALMPFQVFACWNGATAFTAAPLLHGLHFRDPKKDECFQGEPQLFCKDLWYRHYRKIAVVPSVNLEYSDEKGADIKNLKGYASEIVSQQHPDNDRIEWRREPPEKVNCMPSFDNQRWLPWNESLPLR